MTLFLESEGRRSHAYVLRLWREHAGSPWRAALRPADGGVPIGFGDLEALAAFLLRLNDSQPLTDNHGEATHGGER